MPNRKIIDELKKIVRLRGRITEQQREYARVQEMAMLQLHPIPKPAEERRFSSLRTLDKYIGESAFKIRSQGS